MFQPNRGQQQTQRYFEDADLPRYAATVPVSRRKVQIVDILTAGGAQSPVLIDGKVDGRDAWQLTFFWRDHPVKMIVATLPFRKRKPTERQIEQAKRQALATLYEYLQFNFSIRHFLPDFEPFAAYMLAPNAQSDVSIGEVIHQALLEQADDMLTLPETTGKPGAGFSE
jgi:hypothetical protein